MIPLEIVHPDEYNVVASKLETDTDFSKPFQSSKFKKLSLDLRLNIQKILDTDENI